MWRRIKQHPLFFWLFYKYTESWYDDDDEDDDVDDGDGIEYWRSWEWMDSGYHHDMKYHLLIMSQISCCEDVALVWPFKVCTFLAFESFSFKKIHIEGVKIGKKKFCYIFLGCYISGVKCHWKISNIFYSIKKCQWFCVRRKRIQAGKVRSKGDCNIYRQYGWDDMYTSSIT